MRRDSNTSVHQVKDGTAIVSAEFRLERDSRAALDDVRSTVTRIRGDLPREMLDPVITKVELSGKPILTYTIAAPNMSEEELSWFVDNNMTKLLLGVNGVGAVNRVGGVTRAGARGARPDQVAGVEPHRRRNFPPVAPDPAGSAGRPHRLGGMEQSVRTVATVQTAEQLAQMEIGLRDGRRVRLDQVANVSDTIAERRSAALLNGKQVVGLRDHPLAAAPARSRWQQA